MLKTHTKTPKLLTFCLPFKFGKSGPSQRLPPSFNAEMHENIEGNEPSIGHNKNVTASQSDSRLSFASSSTGYSSARSSLRSTEGPEEEHHDVLFSPSSSQSEARKKALLSDGGLTRLQMIASELIETERAYVNDLWQIIQGYLNHLVDIRDSLNLTVDELSQTFGCIERIFLLNRKFYVQLDEAELDCLKIARGFIDFAANFDDYVTYCTNYPRMLATLSSISSRSVVAEALETRQQQLGHSLPLSSYLLKPVQRILKYPLFIEQILKEFTAIGVPSDELKVAKMALDAVMYQASRINRSMSSAPPVSERKLKEARKQNVRVVFGPKSRKQRMPITMDQVKELFQIEDHFIMDPQLGVIREMVRQYEVDN